MKETNNKRKRVLVVSRNYNNLLCTARSLAGGDYDIELVRIIQLRYGVLKLMAKFNPERTCKYVKKYHVCLTDRKPEKFIQFLMDIHDPERETLIVPCDDISLPWLDDNYELLKDYYILSDVNQTQGKLKELMNKQRQKDLAKEAGLPAPGSHEVCIRGGEFQMPKDISYPCFLKPAVLVMGSKDYLKRYDNDIDLALALEAMAERFGDIDVVVEDFIDIKKEYAVLGLCAGGKVLIPDGCLSFVEGGHGSRKGIMAVGEVISSPEILEFLEKLKAYLSGLGYTGLFDVDVLASDTGLYFCELNLRFGGSGYAITQCDVNLPKMYAEFMLNGTPLPDEVKLNNIGSRFVSEKILLEDVTEGFITKQEAEEAIEAADIHFIKDEDDPKPYKRMRTYFATTAKTMMTMKNVYKKLHH